MTANAKRATKAHTWVIDAAVPAQTKSAANIAAYTEGATDAQWATNARSWHSRRGVAADISPTTSNIKFYWFPNNHDFRFISWIPVALISPPTSASSTALAARSSANSTTPSSTSCTPPVSTISRNLSIGFFSYKWKIIR